MKTIIFVCLLSLSMCLSQPTTKSEAPASTQLAPTETKTQTTPNVEDKTAHKANETKIEPTPNPTDAAHEAKTTPKEEKPAKPIDNKTDNKNPKDVPEKTPTEKAPPSPATAPTENKPAKTITPAANETKPTDANANNAILPADKDKKKDEEKTTVHPAVVTPTVAPNVTEKPTVLARGFDGASFVGGIILTLGLLAIGFMGFKYYKNQTERNYHTL